MGAHHKGRIDSNTWRNKGHGIDLDLTHAFLPNAVDRCTILANDAANNLVVQVKDKGKDTGGIDARRQTVIVIASSSSSRTLKFRDLGKDPSDNLDQGNLSRRISDWAKGG